MLGAQIGQGRCILSARPAATASCCVIRMVSPGELPRMGEKDLDRTKERTRTKGVPSKERRACENRFSAVFPGRMSNPSGGKEENRDLASETPANVCEDADDGRGGRKTSGRDGTTPPRNGGTHARAPKGANGSGATSDRTGSEKLARSRSNGSERTITTRVGGTENGS